MVEKVYRFQYGTNKKSEQRFWENFFKSMNNAVFGKTLESLRKHPDVKLILEGRKFKKLVAKPNFKSFKIFSKDFMGVHMSKTAIKLVKPTYVGFSIFHFSETFMYNFYYKKMV